jgi:hypothetical protein
LDVKVKVGEPLRQGSLTLYPLWNLLPPAPAYVPGPLAPTPEVHIEELDNGGQVDTVQVGNAGSLPLLLVEGELLSGAQQDRTLNVSILLPAAASVDVPVSCVEAGRWGGSRNFARADRVAAPSLRWSKTDGVNRSARQRGERKSDQGQVWARVDDFIDRFSADARPDTSAYTAVEAQLRSAAELPAELTPADGQTGVAVALGDRLVALDLFDRPETLDAYWDSLVSSYVLEGLDFVGTETAPDASAVESLLGHLAELEPLEMEGVGLGQGLHLDSGAVRATALSWEGSIVHLGVLVGV